MPDDVSRLVVGTAPLGLAYGIGRDGHPPELLPEARAVAVMRHALSLGVCVFDTAPAYGVAEQRVGLALADADAEVWTKAGHGVTDGTQLEGYVLPRLAASLTALGTSRVALLQWHNWTASLAHDEAFLALWRGLAADARVGALGATTYGPDDALAAVDSGLFSLVQMEWNVLNQATLLRIGQRARTRGVRVALRSVLLQGVLTASGAALPPHLVALAPHRARAAALAESVGLDLGSFAIRAALDQPNTDHVLVGVDGEEQLEHAVRAARAPALSAAVLAEIAALHADGALTDPRAWKR